MSERYALQIFEKAGAILTNDHFELSSGQHSDTYINKAMLYADTRHISELAKIVAVNFSDLDVDVVVGPALGGIALSQWTAYHLSNMLGKQVLSLFAEKDDNSFNLKRGYEKLVLGKNVLVVEDILTTGLSAKKVVELVRIFGGNVVGLGALWNRGGVLPWQLSSPPRFYSVVNMQVESWPAEECTVCNS